MTFNLTLVKSQVRSRPYVKTDGKYLGSTKRNNIGLQKVDDDITSVYKVCTTLATMPNTCMVMGTAREPRINNTDRTLKNFIEEPIKLLVLDLDKYPSAVLDAGEPISYKGIKQDVERFITTELPPEFKKVSYILAFSASFLLGANKELRCHLFFLLEEAQYPREIGTWIRQEQIPTDHTFYFNLTQPIFTAAPIWKKIEDPIWVKDRKFPRLSLVKKDRDKVPGGWQPYKIPPRGETATGDSLNLPSAFNIPGKVGSFCRTIPLDKVLSSLGYTEESNGRFLAPASNTGVPGAMVFNNGYVYSHHSDDPLSIIMTKVYYNKRRCLNAYDIMYGWAKLNKETHQADFEFALNQAILNDAEYQEEIQAELVSRSEWLTEDGYTGGNRLIVDEIIQDLITQYASEMSREYIFDIIKIKTGKIKVTSLRNMWKNKKRELTGNQENYDPEATLRHMSEVFKQQKILYAIQGDILGDFWCYFKSKRLWVRCNNTKTRAFIYQHVHTALPIKLEIEFHKMEQLTQLILRDACLSDERFVAGKGWGFKGGKFGIDMNDLFSDCHRWQFQSAVRTLKKSDMINKELPITYKEWIESETQGNSVYTDFLLASCEEDLEIIELIREFGGYVLADSYVIHKMLIVEGVPGGGKSVLAKIFQEMVGRDKYAAVSIKRLAKNFGLEELPGKKLAIMSEARSIDFAILRDLVPVLLKIVGQDYIDTEAKFKSAQTELLECKLIFMTNITPVMPDDTGALAQRLMMIQLNKRFRGTSEEILGLEEKILNAGLAGIIRWHLMGLERLSERKQFIEPCVGEKAKKRLVQQIDPLSTYIDTFFRIDLMADSIDFILQKDFITYFRAFCNRIGQTDQYSIAKKRANMRNVKIIHPELKIRKYQGGRVIAGLIPVVELNLEFIEELADFQ